MYTFLQYTNYISAYIQRQQGNVDVRRFSYCCREQDTITRRQYGADQTAAEQVASGYS